MNTTFYPQTLPPDTAKLLNLLRQSNPDFLASFYLSGGTALSLQLGHRESEDLDFFSQQPFKPELIEQQLLKYGKLSETELSSGTLNTYLNGVKLQFLHYPYRLLEPVVVWEGVRLSSVIDIACTKLQTVGMRGSRKDFIDIYFLLKQMPLETLLSYTKEKYSESDYSETHILKSLVYFDDAEAQPMPRMHQDISWEQIKKEIITAVKATPML
ncbi:MAG: hypothetical protein KCHDKBKB_02971 [Elusimicrobia bacterium]|nr:hypothetical protein [Elusimicrobiota bacterium]